MWNCSKCDEPHSASLDVCWQCGTDRTGTEDREFKPVLDAAIDARKPDTVDTSPRQQFSLCTLFLLVTCAAVLFGLVRGIPSVVAISAMGVIAANLMGLVAGWFITHVLRFPNDGSRVWSNTPSECPGLSDDA